MLRTSSGILADIVEHKKLEVAGLHKRTAELERAAYERRVAPRPFAEALLLHHPAIISEIKKASPSKGVLRPDFHPALIAQAYQQGGAACLSVLTDHDYFQGGLPDLEAARAAVNIPVLRKDFTIDRLQVLEAAAHNADAILLIAAILDVDQLQHLRELAARLHLAALVEVHDHTELQKAVDSGAKIIGVNNRNLDTFEVSLQTSIKLSYLMPSSVVRVSESGISSRADMELLRAAGFHAFLIGESLMKAKDPAAALKALLNQS